MVQTQIVSRQQSLKTPSIPTKTAPYNEHKYLKDLVGRFTKAKQFIKQWIECEKHSSKPKLTKELLKWEATFTKLFLSKIKSNYTWDNKRYRIADWLIPAYLLWYIADVQESSVIFFKFLGAKTSVPTAILQYTETECTHNYHKWEPLTQFIFTKKTCTLCQMRHMLCLSL